MHRALLGAAASMAVLMITSPAIGQGAAATGGFTAVSASHGLTGVPGGTRFGSAFGRSGGFGGTRDHRHFRHIHVGDGFVGAGWAPYLDYDVNESWRPYSFNDWWHERPDRAYPRWMTRNRDCARPWYSGDVLTC
jgi:hypothetical protein